MAYMLIDWVRSVMILGIVLLLLLLFMLPVHIELEAAIEKEIKGAVTIRTGCFKKRIPIAEQTGASLGGLRIFLRANRLKRLARKSVSIRRIGCMLRISLQDPAKTALLTMGVQEMLGQIGRCLNFKQIAHAFYIESDFLCRGSAFKGSCILFVRLGNLVMMGMLALILSKEAKKWNTQ